MLRIYKGQIELSGHPCSDVVAHCPLAHVRQVQGDSPLRVDHPWKETRGPWCGDGCPTKYRTNQFRIKIFVSLNHWICYSSVVSEIISWRGLYKMLPCVTHQLPTTSQPMAWYTVLLWSSNNTSILPSLVVPRETRLSCSWYRLSCLSSRLIPRL